VSNGQVDQASSYDNDALVAIEEWLTMLFYTNIHGMHFFLNVAVK
jgi:hypothetical protein